MESSNKLSQHLATLYNEKQLYQIDCYLGEEMAPNLMELLGLVRDKMNEPT